MKYQARQPDQWIVVDDGKTPLKPTTSMQYVRREPRSDDPEYTLIPNLKMALPLIKGDKIMIIEDDEYYARGYIAEMAFRLDQHEIVGIGRSRYYHLPSGNYSRLPNINHASFAEMAFRKSFLPEFEEFLNDGLFLDMRIWRNINGKRGLVFIDNSTPLYVGMKGLPGRHGIGIGHNPDHRIYKQHSRDASREILKKWIPRDYKIYMNIINGKKCKNNFEADCFQPC
jgi:hypothetical protein